MPGRVSLPVRHDRERDAAWITNIRARERVLVTRSLAIETSVRGSDAGGESLWQKLRIRNLPAFFRPGSPWADGWITRKLFRSGRLVAFTLRRNVPHNSRSSFFVRPRAHARALAFRRSPVHFARLSAIHFAGGKHCSVKRVPATQRSLALSSPVIYKQNCFAYCCPRARFSATDRRIAVGSRAITITIAATSRSKCIDLDIY